MSDSVEAMKIWKALQPMIDSEIREKTKSCIRSKKMQVKVAPNGETVGVSEPYGETVFQIPYRSFLQDCKVGDAVWVDWYFDNMSTMIATSFGNGQMPVSSEGIDSVYPVGSIYLSVNNANPGSLFGGTWEKITDAFLLGAGGNYALGDTGGNASHTIDIAEMPAHTHGWRGFVNSSLSSGTTYVSALFGNDSAQNYIDQGRGPQSAGGGSAMNIMPPYLAVNIWKRTA